MDKITCMPKKAIRPYLIQTAMYFAVGIGAVYIISRFGGTAADKILAGAVLILSSAYAIWRGFEVFGTSLTISGDSCIIRIRGKARSYEPKQIAYAYYDSNSRNMELHTSDENRLMLIEYDDLSPMTDYLDRNGINIEYKRITLK